MHLRPASLLVGVRGIEPLTSSVSRKRSPPELNALACLQERTNCLPDLGTSPWIGTRTVARSRREYAPPMTAPQQAAAAIALATGLIVAIDWLPTPMNRNTSGMPATARLPSTAIHGSIGILLASANLLRWKWFVLAGGV